MKVLVHIGPTKCGSTSLQAFLALHADTLAARGLRYERWPQTSRLDSSQIEVPVAALAQSDQMIPFKLTRQMFNLGSVEKTRALATNWLNWLDEQRKNNWREDTLLLSSEHLILWLQSKGQILQLDMLLRERFSEVRYVTYLRPQEDWLLSQYAQSLRAGSTQSLQQEVDQRLAQVDSDLPNYAARLRLWVAAIGNERIAVKQLGADDLIGGDLARDFVALAGGDVADLALPSKKNTRFGAITAEAIRQINLRFPRFGKGNTGPNPARIHLVRALSQLKPTEPEPALQLSVDQRKKVHSAYHPGNTWIAAQFPQSCAGLSASSALPPKTEETVQSAEVVSALTKLLFAFEIGEVKPLGEKPARNANGPRPISPHRTEVCI